MKISILAMSSSEMVSSENNSTLSLIRSTLYKNGQEVLSSTIVKPISKIISTSLDYALQTADCVLLLCENGLDKPYMAKRIICEKFGSKLINSIYAKKNIEEYAENNNVPLQKEDMSFYQMPDIARTVKNPLGIFQGCLCEKDGKILFLLPLSYAELSHMFFASVLPYILQSKDSGIKTFVLKTYGLSFGEMQLVLKDFINNKHNIEVVCNEYLGLGEIIVNVPKGVRSDLTDKFIQDMYTKVLPYVYSDKDESEAEFIYTLLSMHHKKLCFAEDFTAGNMAATLFSNIENAKEILKDSFVTIANSSKASVLGVSGELFNRPTLDYKEIAYQMAVGAINRSGADIVVSTFGDINKGELVFAIGNMEGIHIYTEHVEGSLEQKIKMATNAALFELIKKCKTGNFGMGKTII